jgi:iron complex outermembrane receptor protein
MSFDSIRLWPAVITRLSFGGIFVCAVAFASAQTTTEPVVPAPSEVTNPLARSARSNLEGYKKLSLQDLMEIEVTSVARHPEKLIESASAVQTISNDDIRSSGATNLPDALRLASNLQVAEANSSQWAISSRGFDNVLANKLLVMIDGRTVYTPLYAGVYWDVQDTLLEDIDRIEVVSGPGGTLWGANAVNGVINITTKSAKNTQGLFVEAGGGSQPRQFGALRYGGQMAPNLYYRVYAKAFDRDSTLLVNGTDSNDDWSMQQGGFRIDWEKDENSTFTFQGDLYVGHPAPDGLKPVLTKGGNGLARWTRTLSETSDFKIQFYYDRTWRDFGNAFKEGLSTYDFDGQHRFQLGESQEVIWGAGYRLMDDREQNLPLFGFLPPQETLHLYSAFGQDEIVVVEKRLKLVVGSKFEHNDSTGWEVQPNVRVAWTPTSRTTIWAAVSRAVRTPSRTDEDFFLSLTPTFPVFAGGPNFVSEKVWAYELGWRLQPTHAISFSLATFYNEYSDLRSAEPGTGPFNFPIVLSNGVEGNTYGAEWSGVFQLNDAWQLKGGWTFLQKDLSVKPGSKDLNRATAESDDPEHQVTLQSTLRISPALEFDAVGRYVDVLASPPVASYLNLDLRIGWKLTANLELDLVGQNLLDNAHPEFVPASPSPREVRRSVYAKAVWRL